MIDGISADFHLVGERPRRFPGWKPVRRIDRLLVDLPEALGTHIDPAVVIDARPVLAHCLDVDGCGEHLDLGGGFFIAPTVLGDASHAMAVVQEEIFGPVLTGKGNARWTEMRVVYQAVEEEILAELPPERVDALRARLHENQILIGRSGPVQ